MMYCKFSEQFAELQALHVPEQDDDWSKPANMLSAYTSLELDPFGTLWGRSTRVFVGRA